MIRVIPSRVNVAPKFNRLPSFRPINQTCRSKVRQRLLSVSRGHSLYGLQLHDHQVPDNQVGSESFLESLTPILNPDAYLPLDPQATPLQCPGPVTS